MTLDRIKTRMAWGACILGTLLLLAPGFHAACIEGPGDKPEDPCPQVLAHTPINANLSKYSEETQQCCKNPDDSHTWSTADWAAYFGVTATGTDQDKRIYKRHELQMDQEGKCWWELKVYQTDYPGDAVNTRWEGSVDLTESGTHELICTFYNPELTYDSKGCAANVIEETSRTFTLTVIEAEPILHAIEDFPEVPPEGEGWGDFYCEEPCTFTCAGWIQEGQIKTLSYCWNSIITISNVCEAAASVDISQSYSVQHNSSLSITLLDAITASTGLGAQRSSTTTFNLGPCGPVACRIPQLRVLQRQAYTLRIVEHTPTTSITCTPIPLFSENLVVDQRIDESHFVGVCAFIVTKPAPPPAGLCAGS